MNTEIVQSYLVLSKGFLTGEAIVLKTSIHYCYRNNLGLSWVILIVKLRYY